MSQFTHAQSLKRKAWFGTQFLPVDEEKRKELGLKSVEGLLAVQVVGGTGKALNLQANDVLLEINGTKVNSQPHVRTRQNTRTI
jgi:S1-C subfamily serine protease